MDARIREALMAIVGAENYTERLIDLVSYSYDGSEISGRPHCAVWVTETGQVSRVLELAHRHGIAVVPRGAGTGLSGHAVPVRGGIVLDLIRMNRILDIRIPDRLVVVEPGVVYAALQSALAPYGFFYPPDPASGKACTLGGNVATNAGGLKGAKYGTTRDYVLGLQVVLADGSIMRTGARTMKTSSGYDLTRLFVGSEGTLGVVTEITLKIAPKPTQVATATVCFGRLEEAGTAITRIMHSGITPSVLEMIDANTLNVLREHGGISLPPAEAMLLVETDGWLEEDVRYQMEGVVNILKQCGAIQIRLAESPEEAEKLWEMRRDLGAIVGGVTPDQAPEDMTVPMSRIAEFMRGVHEIGRKHGLLILNYGHVGDGNFHPNILYDRSDPAQVAALQAALEELHKLACGMGGTLTGEHGIGLAKAPFMGLEHDPVALRVMRTLKRALDPRNILNPGKMALDDL